MRERKVIQSQFNIYSTHNHGTGDPGISPGSSCGKCQENHQELILEVLLDIRDIQSAMLRMLSIPFSFLGLSPKKARKRDDKPT